MGWIEFPSSKQDSYRLTMDSFGIIRNKVFVLVEDRVGKRQVLMVSPADIRYKDGNYVVQRMSAISLIHSYYKTTHWAPIDPPPFPSE